MAKKAYTITLDRETDGRWIADIEALPGVMTYGATREEAIQRVMALCLRVIADRLDHGEDVPPEIVNGLFAHA